jgi:hypothetical protein
LVIGEEPSKLWIVALALNEEMVEEPMKTAQRFRGKAVNVTIPEVNENELERGRTS